MYLLLQTWFARPALLAGLALVPLLLLLAVVAWLRRRRALVALGTAVGVRRQILLRPGVRRWRGLLVLLGVLLLALAAAGPQWGREPGATRAAGDDLVVVLDLSRSMYAEQPSRLERAVRLLRDLADHLERRGGRRVALVVFAAEARLLFPLTQDYDYFRYCLRQIEDDELPPLNPAAGVPFRSGTRIGAGLRRAVAALDPARAGRQAIVLLSDGDDPAAGDEEWRQGALAARARGIRVYPVGVGDPDRAGTIPDSGDVLRYQGAIVRTRLNEALLEEIARRTGGAYLPAHTHALPLGVLLHNLLEQHAPDAAADDDGLPVYRPRYAWFLAPALALLLLGLLLNEGPARARPPRRMPALAAGLAVLLSSAAAPPDAGPLVRQGNAAFAAGNYAEALQFYAQAERGATDPGRVAYNQAAAHFRLGHYAEAVAGYRQCLDDDQAPAPRRARAQYDLGTALLKQSGGTSAARLRQAVRAFRACLAQPELDADLRADARHNLELAQLLWLKARAANPDQPDDGEDRSPNPKPDKPGSPAPEKTKQDDAGAKGDLQKASPQDKDGKGTPGAGQKDQVKSGGLQVLPDADTVEPLPPAPLDEQLEAIVRRIRAERRQHWQQSARPPQDARNW